MHAGTQIPSIPHLTASDAGGSDPWCSSGSVSQYLTFSANVFFRFFNRKRPLFLCLIFPSFLPLYLDRRPLKLSVNYKPEWTESLDSCPVIPWHKVVWETLGGLYGDIVCDISVQTYNVFNAWQVPDVSLSPVQDINLWVGDMLLLRISSFLAKLYIESIFRWIGSCRLKS